MINLNPNDLASFSLMLYATAGEESDRDKVPSAAARHGALADSPGAAALAFHRSVQIFVRHAVGYDLVHHTAVTGGGLFGVPIAVFGAVEEQGRGSLHLHMMVWISAWCAPSAFGFSVRGASKAYGCVHGLCPDCEEPDAF
jgi:hypothetical protein